MVIHLYLIPFAKFSLPITVFVSFPQLFRRVAAALPGMESTQDRSREDSILLFHQKMLLLSLVFRAPLGWLRNIMPLLFTARNWWLRSIEALRFSIANELWLSQCTRLLTTVNQWEGLRVFACLIFNEQETRRIPAFCFLILSSIGSVQFSYT